MHNFGHGHFFFAHIGRFLLFSHHYSNLTHFTRNVTHGPSFSTHPNPRDEFTETLCQQSFLQLDIALALLSCRDWRLDVLFTVSEGIFVSSNIYLKA